jgi:hypothetical protein
MSRDGAVVGLAFLETALRLNHVRRLTERLSISEHRSAHLTTEVDISLNMLEMSQSAAARLSQQLASHSVTSLLDEPNLASTIWVPVARISRRTTEHIDVRNAAGLKVPTLTGYETSGWLAAGMYQLLRESLISHPDSSDPDTNLSQILFTTHEPLWLIQAALVTLFSESNRPDTRSFTPRTPGTVDDHRSQYRRLALNMLDDYANLLWDYSILLDVALNDHLLIVALDSTSDQHVLTYDSPLYVNRRPTFVQRMWQTLRASQEGYYVHYWSSIPSTLGSYHLALQAGTGVDIGMMYLTTDADSAAVESLIADLTFLADRLQSQSLLTDGASTKQIELETQTVLRQLAELFRRRRWEAGSAGVTLPELQLQASLRLTQAAIAGEATVGSDNRPDNSILHHPSFSSTQLRRAAIELRNQDVSYDLSLSNDPISNRAQAYWRRAPENLASGGQTRIRAGIFLIDATRAGPFAARDALLYAVALAGTTYLVACFLSRSFWPYGYAAESALGSIHSTEAVIAVLLLVPGFLYTRLMDAAPQSMSGHMRAVPRFVARLCIFSTVVLAAAIAASSNAWVIREAFIVGAVLPLVSALLFFRRQPYSLRKVLGRMGAPKWACSSHSRSVAPDAIFSSGVTHD